MKKILLSLLLACASSAFALSPTNVQKGGDAGTNNLTGSFNVGPGVTITISSGGTIIAAAGSTVTGFGGSGSLPDQTGHAGEWLTTNGTVASWAAISGGGDMLLAGVQTVTGAKTFNSAKLILAGSSSGTTILNAAAAAGSGTVVLPTTGTLSTLAGVEALTNKTYNGNTWTAGTATLTGTAGKTLAWTNSITIAGTDSTTLNIGAGGTLGTNAFLSTAFAPLASPTFTGIVTIPSPFTLGATSVTTTGAQLNFVAGVTSAIQTQLDAKQSTITFGTGVQSALANAIGAAGAPVVFNGAGGTPSSINLANGTAYPTGSTSVFGVFKVDGSTITQSGGVLSAVGGGSGNVSNSGTPTAGQIASWVTATTIQGNTTGTGVLTALGVNVGSAGAFITFNGNAGTPSALVGTNISGTAASLTAGNVTTNANLTGAVTSSGNATSLGSFTFTQLNTALTGDDAAGLAANNTLSGNNSFTGNNSFARSLTRPATSISGNVVDLTLNNVQALTGNVTWTFSGGHSAERWTLLRISADATPRTVTLPASVYPQGSATALTSFTVPASSTMNMAIYDDGTTYFIVNTPLTYTGTGSTYVLQTSPTLITPILGVAAATSVNKWVFTAPSTAATLTAGADNLTYTMPGSTQTIPGLTDAVTLTNKRVTARTLTVSSSATPTANSDNADVIYITGLAAAVTNMSTNLTGTPVAFDQLEYWIVDNGTARALSWGSAFVAGPVALPTTTVLSKPLHVYFERNPGNTAWVCMSTSSDI